MQTKYCPKCGKHKLLSEFSKNKNRKDGLQGHCKICKAQDSKRWRETNPDKARKIKQRWVETNRDKERETKKRWYEANRDKVLERNQYWYTTNRDKKLESSQHWYEVNREKKREMGQRWLEANRDKHRELTRHWRETNPDKMNAYAAKRRAAKLQRTPNWITQEHLIEIETFYSAAIAFRIYTGHEYHVDHMVPLQGKTVSGLHVPWNLQVILADDNLKKNNKYVDN